jgi:hypothetical protein
MMKPTKIEGTAARYRIVHTCEACGMVRRNDVALGDDAEAMLAIAGIH